MQEQEERKIGHSDEITSKLCKIEGKTERPSKDYNSRTK